MKTETKNEVLKQPENALEVSTLYKFYPILTKPIDGIKYIARAFFKGPESAVDKGHAVCALRGVSFELKKGERLGIIGRNGAGKSTLLEIVGGKLDKSDGYINRSGEVYTIASGNTGFDDELSARENSENYLRRQGLNDYELGLAIAEIERFVELGDFFEQPIKTYSLGMRVRAEFAAATSVSAEIISIDEVLGAGDIYWAEKCARRMEDLCFQGSALLLVSHSLDQVLRFCDRAIWIENGKIVLDGPAEEVVKRYEVFLERMSWYSDDQDDKTADIQDILPELGDVVLPSSNSTVVRWPGRGAVQFSGVWINGSVNTFHHYARDIPLDFRFEVSALEDGDYRLRYGITFWSREGKRVAVFENEVDEVWLNSGDKHEVQGLMDAGVLGAGSYLLTFSLFDIKTSNSSASEVDTRQDVLYKSFVLECDASEKLCVSGETFAFKFDGYNYRNEFRNM